MTATITPTSTQQPVTDPSPPPPRRAGDTSARVAGLGALAFVGIVILQNVLRGSSAPANGASASDVLSHYADHRSLMFVLTATFAVSGVALATFLGAVTRRLVAGERPAWAYTGLAGGICVLATFTVLLACEQALSVLATASSPDLGAIDAVWTLHNSIFTALWLSIGVALLGLSRAGVAAGITPRAFGWVGPLGAALMAVSVAAGPAIAAGDAKPLFGLALVGFAMWLAFLVTTGIRLVRTPEATR